MGIGIKSLAKREQVFMRKVIWGGTIVLSLLFTIGVILMTLMAPNENLSEVIFEIFTMVALPVCFSCYLIKGYLKKLT
ncbi:hypothetical protein [Thalassotalea castellviae]|uniref:DUF2798 domain-containing protein n=1 Tax=Thalassotalea castellviae TaxID=3075612 RepID=A0ABU3A2S0_9GAMM|nr:hypothetical protein [Thalassotalea sp. W431]MDT0604188.1 hypothetical protein [Thalassotalea sp. W431]